MIDGYFVHYIAPHGLEPVNKNVMFVLDVSGSMTGVKLKQTKAAMATILDDLRPSDVFNIIVFEGLVRFWTNEGAVLATPGWTTATLPATRAPPECTSCRCRDATQSVCSSSM